MLFLLGNSTCSQSKVLYLAVYCKRAVKVGIGQKVTGDLQWPKETVKNVGKWFS